MIYWQLMMQTLLLDTLKNERMMRGNQKKKKWTLFTQDDPGILEAQDFFRDPTTDQNV